jgi:hypothetical protein
MRIWSRSSTDGGSWCHGEPHPTVGTTALPLSGLFLREEARSGPRQLGEVPRPDECRAGWPRVVVFALLPGVAVDPRGPKGTK